MVAAMALAGCGLRISSIGGPTPTAFIITSTLPPTAVPSATLTPIPATPTATTAPIDGMTATQVNVRSQPSTAGEQLGILAPFLKVQIIGQDSAGAWYEILYPQGPGGIGWVTAPYINVRNKDSIPVIGPSGSPPTATSATGTPAASGTVIQQVNVRKGPGTDFDALGMLNAKETAALTGRDASGSWLQITYAAAPGGKGWVAAAFIQSAGVEGLPIIGSEGSAASTPTAGSTPLPASATPAVALPDGDSSQAPGANITLSPGNTRSLIYSSDLSTPEGDAQDFVGFTPNGPGVLMRLTCTGNGQMETELDSQGSSVAGWAGLACGETKTVSLDAGKPYLLNLTIVPSGGSPVYVHYTIRIGYPG